MAAKSQKFCSGVGIMIDPDHTIFRTYAEKKKGGK